MTEQGYEQFKDWMEPEPFDMDDLTRLVVHFKSNPDFSVEFFIESVLYCYYDRMAGGMSEDVGHIIYRLSDSILLDDRQRIDIYPTLGGGGSLRLDDSEFRWYSLEDWRKEWEDHFSVIPTFTRQLPDNFRFIGDGIKESE